MPETKESPSLKYDQALAPGMDYFFLRKEGIRFVQELSGKIWTDYNEHDPGVTILEQCCFALTDIAYRTNIEVEALLFSDKNLEERSEIALSNSLYVPEEVLLSGNVTIQDNTMLFLDGLKNIDNIWFKKVISKGVNGLYDVYVQPASNQKIDTEIERDVRKLFAKNRNLCEDINNVIVLQPEDLDIAFAIDIYEGYNTEEVMAEIYFQLDSYFNRKIQYDSLDTLLSRGMTYEQIFERPSFDKNKGFISNISLDDYQTAFSFSKIQTIISEVKGVRNAQDLQVRKNGIKIGGEQIIIQNGNFVSLSSILEKPSIVINKNNIRIEFNLERVKSLYQQKVSEVTRKYIFNSYVDSKNKNKNTKDIASYNSIQNTFPVTYGIGNYGLSGNEGNDRVQYARQLQGYLLFFDQILLNHLAQLKNIPTLFSIETLPSSKNNQELPVAVKNANNSIFDFPSKTYFEQYPDMIPDVNELVKTGLQEKLPELMNDQFYERKNKLLDHLLARFAERFVDSAHHNLSTIYGIASNEDITKTLVELKCAFLKQYRFLSQYKNKAYNFSLAEWNGQSIYKETEVRTNGADSNVYPFKRKLFLLLNLPLKNEGMVSLVNDYSSLKKNNITAEERQSMITERAEKNEEARQYYKPYKESSSAKVTFLLPRSQTSMDNLIYYGTKKDNYSIIKGGKDDTKFVVFFNATNHNLAQALGEYTTYAEAQKVIDKLTDKFIDLNRSSEGFHVIEHVLLRPTLEDLYAIEIMVENGKGVLLTSLSNDSYEECKKILSEIIILGCHKENFAIVETNATDNNPQLQMLSYSILLRDKKGNDLLKLNSVFASKFIAQTYIEAKLVPFFKEKSQDKSFIPAAMQIVSMKNKLSATDPESAYGKDLDTFYDSQISLVLPSWLPRFNEPDFRALFNQSLCQCLPAHIKVNKIWWNKEEMVEFEKVYVQWLILNDQNLRNELNPAYKDKNFSKNRKERNKLKEDKLNLDKIALALIEKLKPGTN